MVMENQVYYARSPHSEAMVRVIEEDEKVRTREGLANTLYEGDKEKNGNNSPHSCS